MTEGIRAGFRPSAPTPVSTWLYFSRWHVNRCSHWVAESRR